MNDKVFKSRLIRYLVGGVTSLITTLLAFWLVLGGVFEGFTLKLAIMSLALIQTAIQLFAFMHMSEQKKENWERFSLLFTAMTMAIIVIGSLWVMMNLNYNMGMTPEQMDEYMLEQNKKGF